MRSLYHDSSKLGADRWAAMIGVRALSNKNTLIVNAGTATTIDFLGSNGLHYGGWILPGLALMQASLANNTAQLDLATRSGNHGFGTCTNDAIIGGCDGAQVGAILYAMQQAKEMNIPVEKIWIDGGNAKVLAQEIAQTNLPAKQMIEVSEGLVLRGIWAWLLQNF
jgi:type III pantothenate kinase